MRQARLERKRLQRELVETRRKAGDDNLYFLDGETLYPGHPGNPRDAVTCSRIFRF